MLTGPHFSADEAGGAAASNVRDRLVETRNRIASAAMRYGRDPDSVRLIAVSASHSPPRRSARWPSWASVISAKTTCRKRCRSSPRSASWRLTWHFIGQLQTNKTRAVAEHFHWVHTLDRERIAVRLSEQRSPHAPPLNICIQVRLADEPGKGGISKTELAAAGAPRGGVAAPAAARSDVHPAAARRLRGAAAVVRRAGGLRAGAARTRHTAGHAFDGHVRRSRSGGGCRRDVCAHRHGDFRGTTEA